MKERDSRLLWLLAATVLLVAIAGGYLKYGVFDSAGMFEEDSFMAVPFLLMGDMEAKEYLVNRVGQPEETIPEETETMPQPTEPTVQATEPATQPPEELDEEPTEPIVIDESWFDDALFIGDSRTQGLQIFAPLGDAAFFCETGMTVFNVRSAKCSGNGFSKMYLKTLVNTHSYKKIFIGLGINELYASREKILEKYQSLIDMIQEAQPDAYIILQSVMTVSRKKAASKDYFSLESIYALNEGIKSLAVGEKIRYIDVNEWIADEEGYLPDEYSKDGCHLYADGYEGWAQWLMDSAATLGIE